MKTWRCDKCWLEKESRDNVILVICPACQVEMVEIFLNEVKDAKED